MIQKALRGESTPEIESTVAPITTAQASSFTFIHILMFLLLLFPPLIVRDQADRMKSSLVVSTRKDYPVLKGFSSQLERLTVNDCAIKKLDSRILQLKKLETCLILLRYTWKITCVILLLFFRLKVLDMSRNCIEVLPSDFEVTKNLHELNFKSNRISSIGEAFCRCESLSRTLTVLDLSQNLLRTLPPNICDLTSLTSLKLDSNQLVCLPSRFGRLQTLRHFSCTNNQLKTLPASFSRLRLQDLDLFANQFLTVGPDTAIDKLGSFPSLLELSARAIVKKRCESCQEDSFYM